MNYFSVWFIKVTAINQVDRVLTSIIPLLQTITSYYFPQHSQTIGEAVNFKIISLSGWPK
jgi:hypothetical protein